MNVPQATIAKPLTAIDYIAGLAACGSLRMVAYYAKAVPLAIRSDERFAKAVAGRLADIKAKKR
jgi:hypothetical protein